MKNPEAVSINPGSPEENLEKIEKVLDCAFEGVNELPDLRDRRRGLKNFRDGRNLKKALEYAKINTENLDIVTQDAPVESHQPFGQPGILVEIYYRYKTEDKKIFEKVFKIPDDQYQQN